MYDIGSQYKLEGHYKRIKPEMSLLAKIWCCITILSIFAVLEATLNMPIRALVEAVLILAIIGWMNWIY